MSVRVKRGRWIIEIYDVALATKRHVTQEEMRALGFAPPSSERQARKIEREVLRERDRRGLLGREETIGTFATRWPDDYRRGKGGRLRSESTADFRRLITCASACQSTPTTNSTSTSCAISAPATCSMSSSWSRG